MTRRGRPSIAPRNTPKLDNMRPARGRLHARPDAMLTAEFAARKTLQLVAIATAAACGKDGTGDDGDARFAPTTAAVLSVGNPTKDEDPSVLRARNGSLFVAWFSERAGNSDIYITHTERLTNWTTPVRITTDPGGDFYPTLLQDDNGTFHLTWFRWEAFFRGHIWHNTSIDGQTWSQTTETRVTTTNAVDDWVPTPVFAANGDMLVYFVSDLRDTANRTNELYVARKRAGTTAWEPAIPVTAVNSQTEHDHLPFAARIADRIHLVWVRYDTTQATPWLNPKSALFHATSNDGLTWSAPARITTDVGQVVNLFPALYARDNGAWSLIWLSTRLGNPRVFELPVANLDLFPLGLVENPELPPGYSHRITATPTPNLYLAVWTQGPDGTQDIGYRFFRR
jgi:hypothetical protein